MSPRSSNVNVHPALIDLAAGRGLPPMPSTEFMPLLRAALEHGLGGLLLSEVERSEQPWRTIALGLLAARKASVRAWHERLWAGLASVATVLEDAGIEVAIAKGIAAEARWYDRIGERPCNDLDLLLSPAQLGRIDDVIAAIEPSHPLCGKARGLVERGLLHAVDLVHEGVPIDLHVDILKLGVPSRNREAIWERTVPFVLSDGRSLRALDPECSYIHFLIHLNKDRFRRLLGFVDVARVYQRETLDLDAIRRLVQADGLEVSVGGSWDVVVRTLGVDAPNPFRAPAARSLVWRIAWRPSVRLRATESTVRYRHRQWLIAALSRGRAVETARSWIRAVFPPADLLAYQHSEYASRWGAEPVSTTPHSRLWAFTVGRVQASLHRRRRAVRAARLGSRRSGRRLELGSRDPGPIR